ncbi:MAG: hypothetical protein JO257_00760 [Deltaproteobacteria bacterium]|nr:hypothetical protein [Deltaproteobacteria bacterium]
MKCAVGLLLLVPTLAYADRDVCVDLGVQFLPSDQLQIVGWIEDAQGHYVDTVYMTAKTGRYGLGNRPGRFDFNSNGPNHDSWPYGRRITTFPVWAHRHGMTWPLVVFQDGRDDNLSHPFNNSSEERSPTYCAPQLPTSSGYDATTCASQGFSDKGQFSTSQTSLYPPRADMTARKCVLENGRTVCYDSMDMLSYAMDNPFDAVTQATPVGGDPTTIHWAAPPTVDYGNYTLYVEVSKEFDQNASYSFPSPALPSYGEYGRAYRGQPSVVYAVPFTIARTPQSGTTKDYIGYGDPDGMTGTLHPPDSSITTDTPGSGASRLELFVDGAAMDRVRVDMFPHVPGEPPGPVNGLVATAIAPTTVTLAFAEPTEGDPAVTYDIRLRAIEDITTDNFESSQSVKVSLHPVAPGAPQTFAIDGLLPGTDYSVAVRPRDACFQKAVITSYHFRTAPALGGEVDACFVATAAYGSLMANDVTLLRVARDRYLTTTAVGELAVEAYYTFGPALAATIAPSELLRETARSALAPVVRTIRLIL